jgi:hypothetical protein
MDYPCRRAKLRMALVSLAALVIGVLVQTVGSDCLAQDAMSNSSAEDGLSLDMSREQWRERVAEAKRRARQLALENRSRTMYRPPSAADEKRIASERILKDDSLQWGDIVSTNKGLFVFKGRSDRERRDSDFMSLRPR